MMELENKYLVLKWNDIDNALSSSEKEMLQNLIRIIDDFRVVYSRKRNSYVVINQDEPYFPDVLALMEEAESKKAGQG